MSLRINTNVDSLTAYRNLNNTQSSQSTSIERLSSGLRINKAADDAAGLAISQGLTSQINGIGQAVRNAQDGINMIQTADGALTETHAILQRMRTLAVQSANDSNDTTSRSDIQVEVNALNSELDRISTKTTFNGQHLLDGTGGDGAGAFVFHVGYASGDTINADFSGKFDSATLLASSDVTSQTSSETAITDIDTAIQTVSTARAGFGALQNRLQHTINNLSVTQTNLQSSNSAIQDTDMAQEMSNYSRTQILSQAGTSMLKQANSAAQGVLSLLQ